MLSQLLETPERNGSRGDGIVVDREINKAPRHSDQVYWRIENLTVTYGQVIALSAINLNIRAGGVTAVVGPSGSGKTTFICCLNRLSDLVPGCCVSGRVMLQSLDIYAPNIDVTSLRRRVGIISQKPNPFPTTIWRNLELPLRQTGVRNGDEVAQRIEECLRAVGLWKEVRDRLKQPALGLSGGQQQRLCIARALTLKPEALLLDEPCSSLDPMATTVIEELINEFRGTYTTVIITHNLAQARRVGTDVAVFWNVDDAGCLLESGPVEDIFDAPKHELTRLFVSGKIA